MARLSGTVQCVVVGDDFAYTRVTDSDTGDDETFMVWQVSSTIPLHPEVRIRIMLGHWVAMLRQALSDGLTVTISHPSDSAEVTAVQLDG